MSNLHHMRIAIIAVDGFEESELTEPKKALERAGAKVDVLSQKKGEIQGFKHHDKAGKVKVDRTLDEVHLDEYDALIMPMRRERCHACGRSSSKWIGRASRSRPSATRLGSSFRRTS